MLDIFVFLKLLLNFILGHSSVSYSILLSLALKLCLAALELHLLQCCISPILRQNFSEVFTPGWWDQELFVPCENWLPLPHSNLFERFFPWSWIDSSHLCSSQYSAEDMNGMLFRSWYSLIRLLQSSSLWTLLVLVFLNSYCHLILWVYQT